MGTNMEKEQIFGGNTEFNRYGLISAVLLIVGCMGGLAVGLGAVEHVLTLSLVVLPTMATLSFILAVSQMRIILTIGSIAAAIDAILIAYYLIF